MRRALESRWATAVATRWLPLALGGVVLALDAVSHQVPFSVVWTGLLDEPAHLATAAVVLLSVAPRWSGRHLGLSAVVLASAVLIDVDHLPAWQGLDTAASSSRPVTHSLLTALVLLAGAAALVRARPVLAAAAAGVALHLVRDLGTGPGVPLLWPLTSADVTVPYAGYVAALVALAGYRLLVPARPAAAHRPDRAATTVR